MTGLKMSETATNVQRKTFKDLQKAWRTIAEDKCPFFLEVKYKEMWGDFCMVLYLSA